jgi:hypothetical protein
MRSPAPTFRVYLNEHQRWLQALTPKWRRQLAQEMVARWIDHPDCESIWTTIQLSLRVMHVTPDRFIAEIITTRLNAASINMIKASDHRKAMLDLTKQLLREGRDFELADRTSDFADESAVFEDARLRVPQAGLLGRKEPARMYFMRQLSAGFQRWCQGEQPLDDVVRLLTDIAFDCETTTEAVRAARGPRAKP